MIRAFLDLDADSLSIRVEGFHQAEIARALIRDVLHVSLGILAQDYFQPDTLTTQDEVIVEKAGSCPQLRTCLQFTSPHHNDQPRLRYAVLSVTVEELRRIGIRVEISF